MVCNLAPVSGAAFVAPMIVAFISTCGVLWMANYIGTAQKMWIQSIQTRVAVTASMLGSMKVGIPLDHYGYLLISIGCQDAWIY